MSNFRIVTTFHKGGYDKYGKKMLETFEEFWDKDIPLSIYPEDVDIEVQSDRFDIFDFKETCGAQHQAFAKLAAPHEERVLGPNSVDPRPERNGQPVTPGSRFLFEATRFAHKYYACKHAVDTASERYVVWLDADVLTTKEITEEWLNKLVQEGKYWTRLGRGNIYPECGFMIWDTQNKYHTRFWQLMEWMYTQGACFQMKEWHDSFLWWMAELYIQREVNEVISVNIGDNIKGDVFSRSILSERMTHYKGNKKEIVK